MQIHLLSPIIMAGLIGISIIDKKVSAQNLLDKILSSHSLPDKQRTIDRYDNIENNLSLTRTHLNIFNVSAQPVFFKTKDRLIFFEGELYNNNGTLSDPEWVLELYAREKEKCAQGLEGIFAFVICDLLASEIMVFTDRFGLKPVFYYNDFENGLIFAPDIAPILTVPFVKKQRDNSAITDLLTLGWVAKDKTLFKDIKLLPPASCLTYNFKNGDFSIKRYWELKSLFRPKSSYNTKISDEDVVDSFIYAVKNRCKDRENLGLSLSGGRDTRAILAAMGENAKGMKTYTVGIRGCIDEWTAQKISEIAQTEHKFLEIDDSYLRNFEKNAAGMVRLSNGFCMPHELTEMRVLEYLREHPFKILLRGHGGEIAKASLAYPSKVDKSVLKLDRREQILKKLFENMIPPELQLGLKKLLLPEFHGYLEKINTLEQILDEVLDVLSPADIFLYLHIKEYIPKITVSSLEIFRSAVEVNLPFMDYNFLKLLLQLPIEKRYAGEFQRKLIKRCAPALLKIPDSNTLAPLDAGSVRTYISDKFLSLFRKLNIRGFRHYTQYETWYSKNLKRSLKAIVLSEQSKKRELYNVSYLEEILSGIPKNRAAFSGLLGTLAGIELWHRDFLD